MIRIIHLIKLAIFVAVSFAVNQNIPVMIAQDDKFKMTMGSRTGPSFYDVKMMNTHYNCNGNRL
jgi:hypothetical protein